jgi:hypothetical protein
MIIQYSLTGRSFKSIAEVSQHRLAYFRFFMLQSYSFHQLTAAVRNCSGATCLCNLYNLHIKLLGTD